MKQIVPFLMCLFVFGLISEASAQYNLTSLTKDGFIATFEATVAVFDGDPGHACEKNKKGQWLLRYRNNPEAFKGAKIFALGTQRDWRGGKPINMVGLENALGSAEVKDGCVSIRIRNNDPEKGAFDQPIVWVIVLANGERGWLGHPGWPDGQFLVYNKSNEPQTWFVLDNVQGKVFPPDAEAKEKAKKRR